MEQGPTDLDLPFQAVFWAHTARTVTARVKEFDDRLLADQQEDGNPLTMADSWQSIADTHFAFLSFAHVVKACDLIPAMPRFPDAEVLVLLRNFAEHWEEPHGRSGRALDMLNFDPMEVGNLFIGELHYLNGDRRDDIQNWLDEVERVARALVADDDEPIPDASAPLD